MALRRRKRAEGEVSNYEEFREKRIKENNERMKKLGIIDLALNLKSPTIKTSPYKKRPKPLLLSSSPRRSSRLKGVKPVNYSTRKKKGFSKDLDFWEEESSKLVDRNGKDGKHIYDPEKRETCQQCRNQTMALRQRKRAEGEVSNYEEFREKIIKENNERMKKLGLINLALNLKSPTIKTSPYKKRPKPLLISSSPRRSSRLKGVKPVNYSTRKKKEFSKDLEFWEEEGSKLVDRHGKDGKHIYDPEKRETCHQCRQKTSRIHTHCSSCEASQGQFCGNCLNARYGEDVNKVIKNANWVCPVCRGICNCSRCRKAKGLAPTGYLYGKVLKLGFKSVAHYFQTQPADSGEVSD